MIWAVLLLHLCKFIWLGHCLLYFAPLWIDFCPDDMEAHPGKMWLVIELLQPFRINWPQKASKADFILLCIASRTLNKLHFQQVVVFTGGPRESFKAASNNVEEILEVFSHLYRRKVQSWQTSRQPCQGTHGQWRRNFLKWIVKVKSEHGEFTC